jgi:sec-independent protein translocase protein TatB
MFDFSMGEIVVIGAVALIAIGPKELPGVLRSVGQWTTKIRRMASEFQSQFQEALREAEMADLKKDVDTLTDTAKAHFDDPLNLKEATKWEPKGEEAKAEEAKAHEIKAHETKPGDAPPDSPPVTPDGYALTETAPPPNREHVVSAAEPGHPQPAAAEGASHAETPVPEGSGHQDAAGAASGGVHS